MPTSKEVRSTLIHKFAFEEVSGSKHDAVAFFHEGKKIATTRFSRGSRSQVNDTLLKLMARETRVDTLKFFKEMIGCTKNPDDYLAKLRKDGLI